MIVCVLVRLCEFFDGRSEIGNDLNDTEYICNRSNIIYVLEISGHSVPQIECNDDGSLLQRKIIIHRRHASLCNQIHLSMHLISDHFL